MLHQILSIEAKKNTIRSEGITHLRCKEFHTIKIAWNILRIVIKFKALSTILRLKNDSRTTNSPGILLVLPSTIDDTIAACVDLAVHK